MNEAGDSGLSRGAGNADELHVTSGVAIVGRKKFGLNALDLGREAWFRRSGGLRSV